MHSITPQFKEFSSITGVEKIRFLPKAKQGSLQRRTHQAAYDSIKKEAQQEKTMWVPLEAFQFAHDFRMQFQGELTEELTDNLLYEVILLPSSETNHAIFSSAEQDLESKGRK